MTIQQQIIDALVMRVFEMTGSGAHGSAPSIKSVRTTIEAIVRPQYPQRYDGFGRPSLRRYIVARCYIQPKESWDRGSDLPPETRSTRHILGMRNGVPLGGWDNKDPAIVEAREKHDAGTHEMCRARDGDWLILYAIPRKRPAVRHAPYFKLSPEAFGA